MCSMNTKCMSPALLPSFVSILETPCIYFCTFCRKVEKVRKSNPPYTCQSSWLTEQENRSPFISRLAQKVQHIEQSRRDMAELMFDMQVKWE
jgi:hypothetical protein